MEILWEKFGNGACKPHKIRFSCVAKNSAQELAKGYANDIHNFVFDDFFLIFLGATP